MTMALRRARAIFVADLGFEHLFTGHGGFWRRLWRRIHSTIRTIHREDISQLDERGSEPQDICRKDEREHPTFDDWVEAIFAGVARGAQRIVGAKGRKILKRGSHAILAFALARVLSYMASELTRS